MTQSRYHHGSIILVTSMILILGSIVTSAQAEISPGATLQGKILYRGPIPPAKTQSIEQDKETCGTTTRTIPVTISSEGGLYQAVVSVEGLNGSTSTQKYPPLLIKNDQCEFQPHIAVGSVKQPLEVQNLDPILHNTHIRSEKRAFFNVVLLPKSQGIKKVLKEPGLMTISCNKHPFMMGYVHVFDHPYYAITDAQGGFSISNLPRGTHRLTIWHKTLGTIHQSVTIPQHNNSALNIEFTTP